MTCRSGFHCCLLVAIDLNLRNHWLLYYIKLIFTPLTPRINKRWIIPCQQCCDLEIQSSQDQCYFDRMFLVPASSLIVSTAWSLINWKINSLILIINCRPSGYPHTHDLLVTYHKISNSLLCL